MYWEESPLGILGPRFIFGLLISYPLAQASLNRELVQIKLDQGQSNWSSCAESSECVVISGPCGVPIAINLQYASEVSKHLFGNNNDQMVICLGFLPEQWTDKASCNEKKCALRWE